MSDRTPRERGRAPREGSVWACALALRGRGRYAGRMNRELEALRKTRRHVADIAKLAEMAKGHLEEGRFEDASACLRLVEQHAAIGREGLSELLKRSVD